MRAADETIEPPGNLLVDGFHFLTSIFLAHVNVLWGWSFPGKYRYFASFGLDFVAGRLSIQKHWQRAPSLSRIAGGFLPTRNAKRAEGSRQNA
jgi:hypothetical protein